MNFSKEQLVSWYFTAAAAIGRCAPDAEAHFVAQIPKLTPKERSEITSGFMQGINDLLEMSEYWAPEKDARVDTALNAKGLPKLAELREALRGKLASMLRRGAIKTEEEFYLAKEALSNLQSSLTDRQRAKVGTMVMEYEQKPRRA